MRESVLCRAGVKASTLAGWLIVSTCCWLAAVGAADASDLRRTAEVRAVERAKPSVVNIHGEKFLKPSDAAFDPAEGQRRVNGMGTGIVVDERGYVLTNYHVVDGVQKIHVSLADKSAYIARLVSFDHATDLAIVKVEPTKPLPVIPIGTSSDLMTGEPVIAVGNAYGYEHTVTRGIISALHRSVQVTDAQGYDDLIQTDASINPGNSGGPLLNIEGDLIGINVAVRAGAHGIGFAIPVDKAMAVAADLLSTRRLDSTWHGVVARDCFSASSSGVVVDSVAKDSPAARCALLPGDVITSVGTQSVTRPLDLERALLGKGVGRKVGLTVRRDEQPVDLELELAQLPEAPKSSSDPAWETLGLKLDPVPAADFARLQTRYRGGLSVKAVRSGGPAASQGIRPGDVLVGMHVWETISLENVTYILNRPDFAELGPIKFYIVRGQETLFGYLNVSGRKLR